MSLNAITIPPLSDNPSRLFIGLHGWGANAQNLALLASEFQLPDYQMIFPDAPFEHPQAPGGKAWYALEQEGYPGLEEGQQRLRDWLLSLEDSTGIPLARTVIAGFSQGGAMTLDVGLTLPVAGLCSLSGYLHAPPHPHDPPSPLLIVHGTQDLVVPLQAAHHARDTLMSLGVTVNYYEFEMGHDIPPIVVKTLQDFIIANA